MFNEQDDREQILNGDELTQSIEFDQICEAKKEWLNKEMLQSGRYLDLGFHDLDDLDAMNITIYLHQEKLDLKLFHIGGNAISDCGLIDILSGLQWHLKLQEIYLGNNLLTEIGIEAFVGMLGMFQDLRILSLVNSGVTDQNFIQLCFQLQYLKDLQQLMISSNQIGDFGVICLSSLIMTQQIPSLRVVHLGNNPITDYGLDALFKALHKNKSIKVIYLNDVALNITSIKSLSECLQKNSNLDEINLGNTGFSDQAADIIWSVLPQSKIKVIQLWNNHLTDQGLSSLVGILQDNTTDLEYIGLLDNKIQDEELLEEIKDLIKQNQMINSLPERLMKNSEDKSQQTTLVKNEIPVDVDDKIDDSEEELEMLDEELEGTNTLQKSVIKREKEIIKNQEGEQEENNDSNNPLQGQLKSMKWTGEQIDQEDTTIIHSNLE